MKYVERMPTWVLLGGCLWWLSLLGCGESRPRGEAAAEGFDTKLAAEISQRAANDQEAQERYWAADRLRRDSLKQNWDEVIAANCDWLTQWLEEQEMPTLAEMGPEAAQDFGLMVRRCENHSDLQRQVLREMRSLLDREQADPEEYAYLSDELRIRQGQRQKYGTQIIFDHTGQAIPLEISAPDSVEARRARLGLDSLRTFLQRATDLHRDMNRAYYERLGVDFSEE
jgi:hypothetical protein